ncbi:restriction endonuclease subunit S [Escherichia coli]|uniref:restriction endonuclease subunit S n=1 Tax=Escherichia coli TaxID=562 RepID=UPI002405EFC5|nr:restriction endonuclease subunit S [Escherichia coli]
MTNEMVNVPELRFSEFSGKWGEKSFEELFDFHNNLRKPIKESHRVEGIYRYYGATGVIDFVNNYIFDGEYILIGEDGANIISRSAPLVYLAKGKFWVNNHAHILTPKNGDMYYLFLVAENVNYLKYNTGTAQPKLNIQNLKNINVNIAIDIDEQEKIGDFFSKLDRQIELEEQKLAKLEEQKKGYMQKIFSQKIRFKDENGNNYPVWQENKLENIALKVKTKNFNNEYKETFTNSAEFGIVSQRDFFDKDISNEKNLTNYYIVEENDFVYNPRISNYAPVGPINRNKLGRTGIMSPLYTVFKVENINKLFLEYYFKTSQWHKTAGMPRDAWRLT